MGGIKTVLNWSSGKDAALAYHLLQQGGQYDVQTLLTTVNNEHERIVMHGVREELLNAQAAAMGIPSRKIYLHAAPDDSTYKNAMRDNLIELKEQGISTAAFGDIFLEDLKAYREEQLRAVGFEAVFPLWKRDTRELITVLEETGIQAMVICVNEKFLGKEFLGRTVDRQFLQDLPDGVDACGEHGEFHTFVCNAPYFSKPIAVQQGEIVYKNYTPATNDKGVWHTGFWFMDLFHAK
ncbi:ATP-binding protein [Chitinophagaceae bacterium IBVUCB1]|nr:ATP-binding protein [Chitinophagaceae bacterium IBVUCB1]